MNWLKATRCGESSHCVEVAWDKTMEAILVRDSNNPGSVVLAFTRNEWESFIDGAKKGEFDFN